MSPAWTREALNVGESSRREGDQALAVLLFRHQTILQHGVEHTWEVLHTANLAAALSGFKHAEAYDGRQR